MAKYCKSFITSMKRRSRDKDMLSIIYFLDPKRRSREAYELKQQFKERVERWNNERESESPEYQIGPCVVLLNGYPGVGKSTIAKALQAALPPYLPSRLLERHTVLDLCDTLNPGCLDTIDSIWNESFKALICAPDERTVIITTDSLFQDLDGMYRYGGHSMVAWARNIPFFAINLHCDAKTNEKRLCSEERKTMSEWGPNKLTDPAYLRYLRESCEYIDLKAVEAHHLSLDISDTDVGSSMERILEFLKNPY